MTPDVVSRLTPEQIITLLSDGTEPDSAPGPNRRAKAQREVLDAVCAKFGLTPLHLIAQPISVTKRQVLEARPELKAVDEGYLLSALKDYTKKP